ncbi:50S ribosomal protein L29 [Aureicoccus marinus]|jgi:large subunit ribosomal protein L29|uniref:Large ribosomal subunit protein uL29 n=1 Tax=Aureicoccus marinus TaxID=754435 RepID=A0A2S7T3F2_9FLAO|nr:50S ribosomal protein L29 [Aureicoccus marinus]PQJ14433.1 50S ribosomal protein L29 [Aureicoccus marinus]
MKQAEIQGMSVEELQKQLDQLKKEYEQMQMNHAVTPLENPMLIRKTRRTVARLATELSKRDSQ